MLLSDIRLTNFRLFLRSK